MAATIDPEIMARVSEQIAQRKVRVISGGQTGGDTTGLLAAEAMGAGYGTRVVTGGYMPHGFLREGGDGPEFAERFSLQQAPERGLVYSRALGRYLSIQSKYLMRDALNGSVSNGAIIYRTSEKNTGKGAMQTTHLLLEGTLDFHPEIYGTPPDDPRGTRELTSKNGVPVLEIWDVHTRTADELPEIAGVIYSFLEVLTDDSDECVVMVAGPLESTAPGTEKNGSAVLVDAFRAYLGDLSPV